MTVALRRRHAARRGAELWSRLARTTAEADWIVINAPVRRRCPVPADARKVFTVWHGDLPMAEVWQ